MAGLDNVDGPGGGSDGDTETKQEASAHELADAGIVECGAGDDSAHDDEEASDEHAWSASPSIDGGTNEGESGDTADLVHGGDKAGPDAVVGAVEEGEEGFVGSETVEKRTIEAIHCLAEEAKKHAKKQE